MNHVFYHFGAICSTLFWKNVWIFFQPILPPLQKNIWNRQNANSFSEKLTFVWVDFSEILLYYISKANHFNLQSINLDFNEIRSNLMWNLQFDAWMQLKYFRSKRLRSATFFMSEKCVDSTILSLFLGPPNFKRLQWT